MITAWSYDALVCILCPMVNAYLSRAIESLSCLPVWLTPLALNPELPHQPIQCSGNCCCGVGVQIALMDCDLEELSSEHIHDSICINPPTHVGIYPNPCKRGNESLEIHNQAETWCPCGKGSVDI